MRNPATTIINYGIASVWIINGLFCKVLKLVPRHEMIVGRILGEAHAGLFTTTIGLLEILMAVWILSRIKPVWCVAAQVVVIAAMNIMEFILTPDLLLFGRMNALVAALLITVIILNEFIINKRIKHKESYLR